MRITHNLSAEVAIRALSSRMQQMSLAQASIASGKTINRPADDPEGLRRVLDLREMLSSIEQYQRNIHKGEITLNVMDQTLEAVETFVSQALSIASGARSNAEAFSDLGQQIDRIRDQVLQLANTRLDQTYIFAGNQSSSRPFQDDGTYLGDEAPLVIRINQQTDLTVAGDGSTVFMTPEDIFDILETLREAMENGDEDAVAVQRDAMARFLEHLQTIRSRMAHQQEQMTMGAGFLSRLATRLESNLMEAESTDITRAVTELKTQETIYRASIEAASRLLQNSLLRFLR